MHSLLSKIFAKRKINSFQDLSEEEKQTFLVWDSILSKETLTIEDIVIFCNSQIGLIEMKWKDLTVNQDKKAELIPYHTCYRTLAEAITSPKVAREALEKQLVAMIY
ncbi:MAG: hypothetical protein AAB706_02155 [Patescibacteria group bacterium]